MRYVEPTFVYEMAEETVVNRSQKKIFASTEHYLKSILQRPEFKKLVVCNTEVSNTHSFNRFSCDVPFSKASE